MTNSNQLLRIKEVSNFTSIAKSTINLWVAQGKFPKPIALSPTIKVWRLQQLHEWIDLQSGKCISAEPTKKTINQLV
jgi:prophage regulatory protein